MGISPNDFAAKFAECGNAYEAAVYAGSTRSAAAFDAVRMLFSKQVRSRISLLKLKRADCPAEQGLRRIAFGRNNDAVRLAFCETVTPEMIEEADLYGVSEIKVGKGVVEIKFFDRHKALEALLESQQRERETDDAGSIIEAIYGRGDDE